MKSSIVNRICSRNFIIVLLGSMLIVAATLALNVRYHYSRDAQMMDAFISNTMSSVDNTLKDMGRVSLVCFSDQRIQEILKDSESYTLLESLDNEEYMKKLYSSMISIRDDVKGIYIFDLTHLLFYSDRFSPAIRFDGSSARFFKEVRERSMGEANLSGCSLYAGTLPAGFRYTPTYTESIEQSFNLYLVRTIRSFSPYEVIGYIAIRTPVSTIEKTFNEFLPAQVSYALVDENGVVVCSDESEMISTDIRIGEPGLMEGITRKNGNFTGKANGEECLISYRVSDYSGLTLMTMKPIRSIYGEMRLLLVLCILIALATAAIIMVSVYQVTRKSLRRVTDLSAQLAAFDPTDLSVRYRDNCMDEVGVLKESFNQMIDMLDRLVISEYETKNRLQQAEIDQQKMAMMYLKEQINPHFLYNTLDMIRMKAAMKQDNEVAELLMKLVSFYRLSTRVEDSLVLVQQEVEMLDAYMSLMCTRYPDLRYQTRIENEARSCQLPNFILQPLLENCLVHGLKEAGYEGEILLSVWLEDDKEQEDGKILWVRLADSGTGMQQEKLDELNALQENADAMRENFRAGDQHTHIGVSNVVNRLRLYYPAPGQYSIRFLSEQGAGTIVEISIRERVPEERTSHENT